ncbi:MAG: flagellar basal body L-ring protein FlgH [Pseudomonadota bacterium]
MLRPLKTVLMVGGAMMTLTACNTLDRFAEIGKAPKLTPIGEVETVAQPGSISQPATLRTPQGAVLQRTPIKPQESNSSDTSLWRTGSRAFFSDQRASKIGDILTVRIDISDSANVDNTTSRSRTSSDTAGVTNFLGFESQLGSFLPDGVNPGSLVDADSTTETRGSGQVERSEAIDLTVAAIVTQVLPNGNMVIQGRQEVRVNFEVRELVIAGIVRPQDITDDNTVQHTQIAEARISYGGRGQLTDVQQARYGQQLLDILFPY